MEYYITREKDTAPIKTYVDLQYSDFEAYDENKILAWAFIKMHQSDANGWCHEDECLDLFSLSDTLNKVLQERCQAHAVGIKIHEGWFELYFYMPQAKGFENSVKEVLRGANYTSFDVGSARDGKWNNYSHELLPDARQYIQMQNRETIEALLAESDDLSIVRDVEHYCFFQTKTQTTRFSERMQDKGFLYKEEVEDPSSEHPYGVALVQQHEVTMSAVEAVSDLIFQELKADHGIYAGWSTILGADV